ncbi:MAG TPA: RnfH family protein [Luteimonas sp.]|nr:RnfH family protein [Luteimonas sp.]
MRVEVIRAWPRRHQAVVLELPDAATVADALAACGFDPMGLGGCAVFGERVVAGDVLHDGDRLELLRPLQIDPKEARRRRATKRTP